MKQIDEKVKKIYENQIKGFYENKRVYLPWLQPEQRIEYVKRTSKYVIGSIMRWKEYKGGIKNDKTI